MKAVIKTAKIQLIRSIQNVKLKLIFFFIQSPYFSQGLTHSFAYSQLINLSIYCESKSSIFHQSIPSIGPNPNIKSIITSPKSAHNYPLYPPPLFRLFCLSHICPPQNVPRHTLRTCADFRCLWGSFIWADSIWIRFWTSPHFWCPMALCVFSPPFLDAVGQDGGRAGMGRDGATEMPIIIIPSPRGRERPHFPLLLLPNSNPLNQSHSPYRAHGMYCKLFLCRRQIQKYLPMPIPSSFLTSIHLVAIILPRGNIV